MPLAALLDDTMDPELSSVASKCLPVRIELVHPTGLTHQQLILASAAKVPEVAPLILLLRSYLVDGGVGRGHDGGLPAAAAAILVWQL